MTSLNNPFKFHGLRGDVIEQHMYLTSFVLIGIKFFNTKIVFFMRTTLLRYIEKDSIFHWVNPENSNYLFEIPPDYVYLKIEVPYTLQTDSLVFEECKSDNILDEFDLHLIPKDENILVIISSNGEVSCAAFNAIFDVSAQKWQLSLVRSALKGSSSEEESKLNLMLLIDPFSKHLQSEDVLLNKRIQERHDAFVQFGTTSTWWLAEYYLQPKKLKELCQEVCNSKL